MNPQLYVRGAVLAVALGMIVALAFPTPGRADIINVELRAHGGATSYMSCGWHSNCEYPYGSGDALDWDNGDESSVYWRSWGYRSDTAQRYDIAYGLIEDVNAGSCTNVKISLWDSFDFFVGNANYTHTATWTPDWWFVVYGSSGWEFSATEIGYSVTQEGQNCSFGGSHLHLVHASGGWTRQGVGTYYPNYVNAGNKPEYLNLNRWQFKKQWCWYC